jgi:hypothetical protein
MLRRTYTEAELDTWADDVETAPDPVTVNDGAYEALAGVELEAGDTAPPIMTDLAAALALVPDSFVDIVVQTDGTATAWVGKRQTLKDGLTAPPAVVAASLKARALGVTA